MYAPMLFPLTGLASGIVCAIYGAGWPISITLILSGLTIYLIFVRLSSNPVRGFRIAPWHHLWLFLLFAGIGVFDMDMNLPYRADDFIKEAAAFGGRVESMSHKTSGDNAIVDVTRIVDKSGHATQASNCRIIIKSDILPVSVGDVIFVSSPIERIETSKNLLTTGHTDRLQQQGIYYESSCSEDNLRITGHDATITGMALKLRSDIESFIENTPLRKPTQNFLIAILLGDRNYLSVDIRNMFADAGLSHILALSGMHVAIMAGIVMWLLFPMNFAGLYKYRIIIAAMAMMGYAMITGLAPSTVRAAVMLLAVSISIFLERRNTAWNSLLLATFCILLFTPGALFDTGLQLSFTCVAALIFFVSPLNPFSRHDHPHLHRFGSIIISTIVATAATWCLSAYYFGKIPLVFLAANLVSLPLLPAYLVASLLYFAVSAFATAPAWCAQPIDFFPEILQELITWMSNDGTSALIFSPSLIAVFAWSLLLLSLAMLVNGCKTRLMKYTALLFTCSFVVTIFIPVQAEENNFLVQGGIDKIGITYLDKGQDRFVHVPRYTISEMRINGKNIVAVDTDLPEKTGIDKSDIKEYDYLILGGSGCKDLNLLRKHFKFKKMIIHPTVRKATEAIIMAQSDSLQLQVYSIRMSGPYRERL